MGEEGVDGYVGEAKNQILENVEVCGLDSLDNFLIFVFFSHILKHNLHISLLLCRRSGSEPRPGVRLLSQMGGESECFACAGEIFGVGHGDAEMSVFTSTRGRVDGLGAGVDFRPSCLNGCRGRSAHDRRERFILSGRGRRHVCAGRPGWRQGKEG
jgi:hypothetical protein